MTQEIVDAVRMLEQEKGIAADTLMDALQDALLSAYKKTPGAAKYAKVQLDHSTADFGVYELMVPEDLEKRLLDEQFEEQIQAAEAAEAAGEPIPEIEINRPTVDPETGERREAVEPEVELERLELADKLVEITGVAREPGWRSKIAVVSHADGVDPVGACVGPRGSRVRMVVSELRGEKIDIIPYNDEPARF